MKLYKLKTTIVGKYTNFNYALVLAKDKQEALDVFF